MPYGLDLQKYTTEFLDNFLSSAIHYTGASPLSERESYSAIDSYRLISHQMISFQS